MTTHKPITDPKKAMHDAIKAGKTPQARLNHAIDTGCKHLESMKHDGSTVQDVIDALQGILAGAETLKAGIGTGAVPE